MEKNIEKRAANKAHKKLISADKTFDVANVVIMILLFFIFAWPLWFVVIASFSDPGEEMCIRDSLCPIKLILLIRD